MKAKINLKNIFYFIQGNCRYKLFYSTFANLLPRHIRDQIEVRINSMDRKCYAEGQCKICECKTTHLQMCNKACDKPCYPPMLNRKEWAELKEDFVYYDTKTDTVWYLTQENKFINLSKHTPKCGKRKQ